MLGYRPVNNRMVEIRDEEGNCKIFTRHMPRAAIANGLSQSSVIKYAIDHGRPFVKRRSPGGDPTRRKVMSERFVSMKRYQ